MRLDFTYECRGWSLMEPIRRKLLKIDSIFNIIETIKNNILRTLIFRYLQKHGQSWFAGSTLTFVDFVAWEVLDQHRLLVPGCLDQLENIGR